MRFILADGTGYRIVNSGSFTNATSDASTIEGIAFENYGIVNVQQGSLVLGDLGRSNGVITTGTFIGSPGTSMSLYQGDLSVASSVQGATIGLDNTVVHGAFSAEHTYANANVAFTGLIPNPGAVHIAGSLDISPTDTSVPILFSSLTQVGGTLTGTGTLATGSTG